MSATFGKLNQETLELSDGLNIIQAPNEAGKSTWCAFLLSMLYGINSRERDKVGFIAEKNRYAPWSGVGMSGRLDCSIAGSELTLLRETKRQAAPLNDFRALYAGTGDEYPGLTGQNCGETLLGVTREVYERSAFIRQAGLAISQDAGLEKRIAALITTGQEDTSYSEVADTLKKQLNRRRYNKTGQLPVLENELAEAARQLDLLAGLESQLVLARQEISQLSAREADLSSQLLLHDQWDAAKKLQSLAELEATAADAEQTAAALRRQADDDRLPENETIARLRGAIVNLETVRKSVARAMAEKDAAMKASVKAETDVSENPFAGHTVEESVRAAISVPAVRKKAWWLSFLLLLLGAGALLLLKELSGYEVPIWAIAAAGCGCFMAGVAAIFSREKADRKKQAAYLAGYGVSTAEELSALADAYASLCQKREDAQNTVVKTAAVYDELYASLNSNEQGILLEVRRFAPSAFDIPAADTALRACAVRRRDLNAAQTAADTARMRSDLLKQQFPEEPLLADTLSAPPERSREELESALADIRVRLSESRSTADQLSGQMTAMGSRAELTAQTERLSSQKELLEGEYQSIALAMEALEHANTEIQNRFSPELGRRTAEIFSALTEGAYTGVTLDRSFHLAAEPAGDLTYRDAQLLSAGATDQLYLAARLAICEMVLPKKDAPPLVLDDALANFDDLRCESALRWLKAESQHRQILLFTCHSREAAMFKGDPEVTIGRLTNHIYKV